MLDIVDMWKKVIKPVGCCCYRIDKFHA